MRTRSTSLLLLFVACAACDEGGARDPLPNWSEGYEQGTGEPPDAGVEITGDFGVFPVEGTGIETRVHRTNSSRDCVIDDVSGTPDGFREIDCTLDIEELDLKGPGLAFLLHAPRGLCPYLIYWWYQYEVWEVGEGPAVVSYTVDEQGNFVDEVNSVNGIPVCQYDYHQWGWGEQAPNCCLGSYVLEVTHALTGETTTFPPVPWAGNAADCYGGAAFVWPDAQFSADGWPAAYYQFINRAEHTEKFEWPDVGPMFHSNVPFANYWDPDDHDGQAPAGLRGENAVEHYNLVCADEAYEWLARVKLTVREWNEQAEFESDEDPDTQGTEASGEAIDDFADWAVATPGASTWLEDRQ